MRQPTRAQSHRRMKNTLRKQYAEKFRGRVSTAEDLREESEKLAEAGDVEGAIAKIKLALSFDPLNDAYKQLLRGLESRAGES